MIITKGNIMRTKDLIEGIQILDRYRSEETKGGYNICASHDEIGLYPTDESLSEEDLNRMEELGFFQSRDDVEIPEDEEWSVKYYDSGSGWRAFV